MTVVSQYITHSNVLLAYSAVYFAYGVFHLFFPQQAFDFMWEGPDKDLDDKNEAFVRISGILFFALSGLLCALRAATHTVHALRTVGYTYVATLIGSLFVVFHGVPPVQAYNLPNLAGHLASQAIAAAYWLYHSHQPLHRARSASDAAGSPHAAKSPSRTPTKGRGRKPSA